MVWTELALLPVQVQLVEIEAAGPVIVEFDHGTLDPITAHSLQIVEFEYLRIYALLPCDRDDDVLGEVAGRASWSVTTVVKASEHDTPIIDHISDFIPRIRWITDTAITDCFQSAVLQLHKILSSLLETVSYLFCAAGYILALNNDVVK